MAYRNYGPNNGFIVSKDSSGDFTTIQAAITAATSPTTIFIKPGTYTENLTLKVGVNICAFECDAFTPNVVINGKCTFTAAGTVSISGIELQTNSDYLLVVSGNSASVVDITNCYLNCLNNTGINFTSSSASAKISLSHCQGTAGVNGAAIFTSSSSGLIQIDYCHFTNFVSSTTANSISAGTLKSTYSYFQNVFSTSGSTASFYFFYAFFDTGSLNTTAITHNSTQSVSVEYTFLASGSASAISIGLGATLNLYASNINSGNTNAITGSGTLSYAGTMFTGTSSTINTTTQIPIPWPTLQGGTGLSSYTSGDTLYASATNVLSKLAKGTDGQVLTLASGIPSWATPAAGTVTSVSGTTNRITSTGGNTPIIDIAAGYVGQSSITTLGTIGTGIWNAGSITTSGNINIPASNSAGTTGIINAGGYPIVKTFPLDYNYFFGGAGNLAYTISTGQFNYGFGVNCLTALTTGFKNIGMGYGALNSATTGYNNCAYGHGALQQITDGNKNCAFGYYAGNSYTGSESSNICIGDNVVGTAAESNKIRIGAGTGTGDGQANKCFISGIQGISVTGTAVLVSSSDQLGVAVSSKSYKDYIIDMGDSSSDIIKLSPVTFLYKNQENNTTQYGLIAEEVHEIFPDIVVYDKEGKPETVQYHNLPAILLNELQKALKRIEVLENKLKTS